MFRQKTVFVIGAGASAEYHLPVGGDLAEKIYAKTDIRFGFPRGEWIGSGDKDLYNCVRQQLGAPGIQEAFLRIRAGVLSSNSIDDFLDRHDDDKVMLAAGKSAIVKTILEAEAKSPLAGKDDDLFNPISIKGTWLSRLVRMLGTGVGPNAVFENVSFISFNYDRCLERVLRQMLRGLYDLAEPQTEDLMARFRIFYPYGTIGSLSKRDGTYLPFGMAQSNVDFCTLGSRIFTYTEQVTDPKGIAQMRQAIIEAQQVVFLGFAFHAQNMNLLATENGYSAKKIYATIYQVSPPNASVMRDRIIALFDPTVHFNMRTQNLINMEEKTAGDMLDWYSLALTA